MQNVIVIQGGSATGKSTIAQKLATDLGYFKLTKDDLKEMLYDKLGTPVDRELSTLYGKATTTGLFAMAGVFLKNGKNVIMESAFFKEFADADVKQMVDGIDMNVLQIYCVAGTEVRKKRHDNRIASGERHQGHPDTIGLATLEFFSNDNTIYGKLDIEQTYTVRTDTFDDQEYRVLLDWVKKGVTG